MADENVVYGGPIVTRDEAKERGLKRFFTGLECRRGHISERFVGAGCVACQKIYLAARYRSRADEFKAAERLRVASKRAEVAASRSKHYAANRERLDAKNAEWRRANPDKVRAQKTEYRRKNPEKMRLYYLKSIAKNPEIPRASKLNRRARERAAGGAIRPREIKALIERQRFKCAECNTSIKKKCHLDHIMPLALGGSGAVTNMQALCPQCNWRKNAKHPIDWAQENGRLL